MADPGFPVGGVDLVAGCGLPRWLRFENFVSQNERIWTLRLGGGAILVEQQTRKLQYLLWPLPVNSYTRYLCGDWCRDPHRDVDCQLPGGD